MIAVDRIFSKSILAGITIGFGGYINLSSPNSIVGAILFSVGLLSVVIFNLNLFTGKSGFLQDHSDFRRLILVLLLNLFGAMLFGILAGLANDQVSLSANEIVSSRLDTPILKLMLNSVVTGFLMTLAIESERDNSHKTHLPLILCVVAFILGGCYHCIADAFYYSASSIYLDHLAQIALRLFIVIVFNFIGCNLVTIMINHSLFLRNKEDVK